MSLYITDSFLAEVETDIVLFSEMIEMLGELDQTEQVGKGLSGYFHDNRVLVGLEKNNRFVIMDLVEGKSSDEATLNLVSKKGFVKKIREMEKGKIRAVERTLLSSAGREL
ncbi:MAG: hypothetical protein GOU99_01575 [Candidatus Altiarchaeota archaeon]|nr:hypothetical protein [Candidatus Altiarchaeota archaeon]